jgi:hypothetical protein
LTFGPREIAVSEKYAYVANCPTGLWIMDVSNPSSPQTAARVTTAGPALGVAVSCNRAFVAERQGMEIFDVSQPSNPQRVGAYNPGGFFVQDTAVAVEGLRAYLATHSCHPLGGCGIGRFDVIDISDATTPRRLGAFSFCVYGGGPLAVAVSGGYAIVQNGPLLMLVDVSDPSNPTFRGGTSCFGVLEAWIYSSHTTISGHYLYVLPQGQRTDLRVFDIENPDSPQLVGCFDPNLRAFSAITVVGGYAYVTGSNGLEVIDVRNPARPRQAAYYATAGGPLAVSGQYAYIASSNGLEVIDLTPLGFSPGSITRLLNGQVQFILANTMAGQSYTVEASTNLANWVSLETRTASGNTLRFTDTNAPNFSHRFYRALAP